MGKPNTLKRYYRKVATQGTETSKYLEEEKIIMILRVVASESGTAQTDAIRRIGVVGPAFS